MHLLAWIEDSSVVPLSGTVEPYTIAQTCLLALEAPWAVGDQSSSL